MASARGLIRNLRPNFRLDARRVVPCVADLLRIFAGEIDRQLQGARSNHVWLGSDGSTGHLQMLWCQQAAGVKILHAPYRGAGPMITDALGGHIDLAVGSAAVIAPHVRAGKLRGLAVTSGGAGMADVPALTESGIRARRLRVVGTERPRRASQADPGALPCRGGEGFSVTRGQTTA